MGFVRKFKTFTLRLIAAANIVVVALMCVAGYAGHVNPEAHPTFELFTLAFPLPLLLNVGFLFFWLIFHYRYAWIPVAGFLLCASPLRTYIPFNFSKERDMSPIASPTFTGMTTGPTLPPTTSARAVLISCASKKPRHGTTAKKSPPR